MVQIEGVINLLHVSEFLKNKSFVLSSIEEKTMEYNAF